MDGIILNDSPEADKAVKEITDGNGLISPLRRWDSIHIPELH